MPKINIKLKKGMNKFEVNELIKEYILLEDELFLGVDFKHDWKCECGNVIKFRTWRKIKYFDTLRKCKKCKHSEIEQRYKAEVEKDGEYKYIRSYRKHDVLPNGRVVGDSTYIQVKHKYCGSVYEVNLDKFINRGDRCSHCCGSYENSFAYHIEQELKLDIEDVWDYDKNKVNPYHISKGTHRKVWIKCQEKDYHGSYEVSCSHFSNGKRCSYCGSHKTHPLDSFGQYLKDNGLLYLWSDKNTVDPFTIGKSSSKKIWMLCDKVNYHNDNGGYETKCYIFIAGHRCPYCHNQKVHPKDSFAAIHPDKAKCWHEDNDKSPYEVSPGSGKKYKFACETCEYEWNAVLSDIANGTWCPKCNFSKGEKKVSEWLDKHNIEYEKEKIFNGLISDLGNPLRFDFYLPKYNLLIEYDGLQHDKWIKTWMSKLDFEKLQYHDKLKNEYAKNNNIKLMRIKEKDFDEIETILTNTFGGGKYCQIFLK